MTADIGKRAAAARTVMWGTDRPHSRDQRRQQPRGGQATYTPAEVDMRKRSLAARVVWMSEQLAP